MTTTFEYGTTRIKDMRVLTTTDKRGEVHAEGVMVGDRRVQPSKRFWNSLHTRFGFTANVFRYFNYDEVFNRISEVNPTDKIRYCIGWDGDNGTMLSISNPKNAYIDHADLMTLLKQYDAEEITYHDGIVTSRHSPRAGGTFAIAGDDFKNKFVMQTPIDGYGKPSVFLSLLRLVCSNGAVAYSPTFRSEVNLGRSGGSADYSLIRVLEGFNNEEGFAALRDRFEAASKSWASVNEINRLYRTLMRMNFKKGKGEKPAPMIRGGDGAAEMPTRQSVLRGYHTMAGNPAEMYGLANLNALSAKRQRTLPAKCTVYDMINFVSEVATHHAVREDSKSLQAFLGDLISTEYDLEGTIDHFPTWKDFFLGGRTSSR